MSEYCDETGKIIYKTKAEAYRIAKASKKKHCKSESRVYKCEKCGNYHLTHAKRTANY